MEQRLATITNTPSLTIFLSEMRTPSFSQVDFFPFKKQMSTPLPPAVTPCCVSVTWILERMKGQGQVWEGRGVGEHGPVGKWVRGRTYQRSVQSKENMEAWKTGCPHLLDVSPLTLGVLRETMQG